MQQGGQTRRWPALDGLRAIAVVAVVVYHLDESLVPGGFLGVSLFFSISGFLIVGQLAAEHDRTGQVDLRRFWTRRIRRLAPAFTLTVVATVIAVAIREPDAVDRVVADALAGIAYMANWHDMAAQVGYAERFADTVEPLAHLWSLSIEEQVYLFAPLAVGLWGVRKVGWLVGAAVTIGVIVWWGSTDAYFATPVRLAEVAAGAVLGVRVFRGGAVPRWLVRASVPAAVAGVAAILMVSDTDPMLFRLGLPLAAIVWVPLLAGAVTDGRFARVLSVEPLRWIGDRSYAIYLFHVPLIELTDWSAPQVVLVTLLAAEVSQRIVEMPVREGRVAVPRLLVGIAVAAMIAGAAAALPQSEPDVVAAVLAAVETQTTAAAPAETPPPVHVEVDNVQLIADVSPTSTLAPPAAYEPPTGLRIATIGDSTIHALEPALEALLAFSDSDLVSRSTVGCSPLFSEEREWNVRFSAEPDGFVAATHCRPSLVEVITEADPVDAVVMFDHGMALAEHQPVGSDDWLTVVDEQFGTALRSRYERWIDEAANAGVRVVMATVAAPSADSIAGLAQGDDAPRRAAAYNEIVRQVAERSPETVLLVDLAEPVSANPARYGRADGVHFTQAGGVAVLVDYLGPAIQLAVTIG